MSITGELSESRGELEVEWKITDFFSPSEKNGERYHSPPFSFMGVSWSLRCDTNSQKGDASGWIELYLLRKSTDPPVFVKFTLGIKTAEGIKTKLHSSDTFEKGVEWGVKFISRSDLLEKKSQLVPSDVLTITCDLKHPHPNIVERTKELSQDMKKLWLNGEDSDVTISVQGKKFPVHKIVIAARTPAFHSMFKHDMKEKTTGMVSIDDCNADVFRMFLHYIYTGTVEGLTPGNMFGLYEVANKYQMSELKADCLECMKRTLSVETFWDVFSLALKYEEEKLVELASKFFAANVNKIIVKPEWVKFMSENTAQANELLVKALVNK